MNGYTECPNCVMDRIIVPLKSKGSFSVCPVCEKTFEKYLSENHFQKFWIKDISK